MDDLISRQAAIDLLDNLIGMVDDNHGSDYDAALRMGIEALKAEEPNLQQTCNQLATDLISRQAAEEALYDWELCYTWDEHCREDYDSPYIVSPTKVIDALPSAEPETCAYWDRESNLCALHRPSAQPEDKCSECDAWNKYKNYPSAEPVRKGKWIEVYDADNLISGKCSVCGWEAHLYEDDVFGMPYCPNCGARLSEGEEDDCN